MANPTNNQRTDTDARSARPTPYTGGVFKTIELAFSFLVRLIIIIVIAIVIEVALTAFGFYDSGTDHAKYLLMHYYHFLLDDSSNKKYLLDPLNNAVFVIKYFSSVLGINLNETLNHTYSGAIGYLYIVYFCICIVLIKLAYLVSTLPLFAIVWVCMCADGMIQRTKRKYVGTPDSMYKWAISLHLLGTPLVGVMFLFLVLPFSIHPAMWLLPIAFISGIGLRSVVINFNKFL